MAETESKKRTPRDLLRMVFRRWRLFLLSASLFAVVVMLGGQRVPLKYTGETKFERRSDPSSGSERDSIKGDSEARKLTLEYELIGLAAMAQAAEDEGLTKGLPHDKDGQLTNAGVTARQELVKGLMAAAKVSWDARSEMVDLITVSFTHFEPNLAERLPNTLVRNYINRTGEKITQGFMDSREFLRKQIKDCADRLDAQIQKRQEFEVQNQDVKPQDPGYLPQQIQQAERDLDRATSQKTMAETKLDLLGVLTPKPTSAPATTQPMMAVPNPKLEKLRDELQAVRDDRDTAKKIQKMTDSHPTVIAINKKIEMLEEKIREAESQATSRPAPWAAGGSGVSGLFDVLGYQVQAARREIELADRDVTRLRTRRAELDGLMGRLVVVRGEYAKLLEKEKEIEQEKESWQRRESDVQMALAGELANRRTHLSAVQAAQRQSRPSSPSLMTVLGFAVVGGLGFGAALVFLMQLIDRSITTTEEAARHFGLPVQGVIEEIIPARVRVRRHIRKWILTPAVSLVVVAALLTAGWNIRMWLQDHENHTGWVARYGSALWPWSSKPPSRS